MDLFDVVRSCFRRWYIVLPLLVATGWFAHHVYESVKPVYYSNAVISLAPPSTRIDVLPNGSPVPRNGLLDVGGAGLIANLTAIGLNDPAVVAQVVAGGGQGNYRAIMFPVPANSPQMPLIMIEATEADPASASKTVELVVAQADPTLRALQQQADVSDDQMVKPFTVSPPSVPAPGMPSRTRSTIAIVAAGAGIAILVGVVIDVLLMRWKARRQKRRQSRVLAVEGADQAHSADQAHDAAFAHDAALAREPALDPVPLPQPVAPAHEVPRAHGLDPAPGADSGYGVDPAEVYSSNKHAAADEVRTDSR